MISNKNLGKRLQKYRTENHITQAKMAEYCELTKNHISAIERGVCTCKASTLIHYAQTLKISLDELVGFSKEAECIPAETPDILPELLEALSSMNRKQQRKLLDVIDIFSIQSK